MRPWTIMYLNPQKDGLQCVEQHGPFDKKGALPYFQQQLAEDCDLVAIFPGCHSPQVVVPQYCKDGEPTVNIGEENGIQ